MIKVDGLGTSTQPPVSEIPCLFRANCPSSLIKHRRRCHGYVADQKRSRPRAPAPSRANLQTTAPRYDSFSDSPKRTISSDDSRACYSAKYSSAPAYPSVTSPPVVRSFDNKHCSAPVAQYGEAWNDSSYAVAEKSIHANLSVTSQNNYNYRGDTTLPFPILPNGPATVSRQNSFYYITNNEILTSTHVARTSPQPPYNSTSFTWPKAGRPEAESINWDAPAPYTSNYGSSPPSYFASPESPLSPVEQPLDDNNIYLELDTLYGDASNYNRYTGTLTAESIDANPFVAPQNNYADHVVPLLAPTSIPIQPVLQEPLYDDYSASSAIEISDLETKVHEDEIFFRGTGREGCLCPDMMINAGVEGWYSSLLDTHQEYYGTYSFA
ncbi:hypothetical protein J3R83DRAFT_5309 [Lanmaoa asiatica]|nr:hypothetical protein J3R83DRAFT_5309 [Lanmaoa asiatica]